MQKINILDDLENKTIVDDDLLLDHNQILSNQNNIQENTIKKDSSMKRSPKLLVALMIIAVLAGVGTGFGTFKLSAKSSGAKTSDGKEIQQLSNSTKISAGDVFGSTNKSFKDSAEGYLAKDGIGDEGSHRLLRPGGESQTVYLTSSVTDLDKLVGMEVKVWGETFKGQKAGWLMDVGRVEIIKTQAESPLEE